ncbi:MAG: metal-dependent hydrolase [Tenuifilaceae bacterium]
MDSLTHILIGASIGEATLGKKIGNKAMLIGALISTIPDLDVFITPFMNPVDALFFHRGISHSILFNLLIIPLLAWLILKIDKRITATFKDLALISFLSLFGHLLVDCFNTYGTGYFEPFNIARIAYDSMAIIDIFIIIPLVIISAWILFYKRERKERRILAWIGISFVALYFSYTVINKSNVDSIVKDQLEKQNISYNRILTSPLPLTNLLWIAVAEDNNGYHIGYYCNLDESENISFRYLARNAEYIDSIKENKDIKNLLRFTKGFYKVDSLNTGEIKIYDLRYGGLDLENKDAYVFTFGVTKTDKGIEISRANPDRNINLSTIKKYLIRVFSGNQH